MKMKQRFLILTLILSTFLCTGSLNPGMVHAQIRGGMMQGATQQAQTTQNKTVVASLDKLLQKYNVASTQQLDCSKVTNEDLEKFGDVVMGAMAGNEKSHESMEKMMGGEGSQSLKNVHIKMGQRYLGCINGQRGGVTNMMGYRYGGGMMGGWTVFGGLTWALLVVFLILGSIYFWREITKKRKG